MNQEDSSARSHWKSTLHGAHTEAEPSGPVRVQLSRAKGWKMPPNTVKVDRTTKWGNPFAPGVLVTHPGGQFVVQTMAMAVQTFLRSCPEILRKRGMDIADLRGKNLACWCKPGEPCHADVLLDLANADTSSQTVTGPGRNP